MNQTTKNKHTKNSTGSRNGRTDHGADSKDDSSRKGKKTRRPETHPKRKRRKGDPRETGRGKSGFRSFPRKALAVPEKRSRGTEPLCATSRSSRRRKKAARRRGKGEKENPTHEPPTLKRALQALSVLWGRKWQPKTP